MLKWLAPLSCVVAASASAGEGTHLATVSARLNTEGVRAVIQLDHAVTRFAFSKSDVERKPDMDILTPGVKWSDEGGAVIAERAFRRFEVQIKPTTQERDAKYPAFFRVGKGGVLYAPTLKAGENWRTQLRVATMQGERRVPAGATSIESSIFIGPASYIKPGADADFILSPDTPALLHERLEGILAAVLRTHTTGLRIKLNARPVMVIAVSAAGQSFQGDVTPGPFVSLRFHGSPQNYVSGEMVYSLTSFIAHEAFHFWNGSLVHSSGEIASPWLHEGGADYAALLASAEAGALGDAGMREELASALTRCRRGLEAKGDVGMNELTFLAANVRYPCGIVIQWAASLSAARAGRGGFYDIWSRMINTAKTRRDHAYTLSDFYGNIDTQGNAPPTAVRLLTAEHGPGRWKELETTLETLGAEIKTAATPETRRRDFVFHLLAQVCKAGPRGFYTESHSIRLQTNGNCVPMPDNSLLTSVEGRDIFAMDEPAYAAMQTKCAAHEDIRIVLDGNRDIAIPCRQPLPPPQEAYVVNRWH